MDRGMLEKQCITGQKDTNVEKDSETLHCGASFAETWAYSPLHTPVHLVANIMLE